MRVLVRNHQMGSAVLVFSALMAVGMSAQQPAAGDVARLNLARQVMGGADKLQAIKTAILKGQQRFPNGWFGRGGAETPQFIVEQLEIRVLLPDHYLKTSVNTRVGLTRTMGLAGGEPISKIHGPVEWQREHLGRLMLWVFLRTDSIYPITFRRAGGDVLHFAEPDGEGVAVTLDAATRLPRHIEFVLRVQATAGPAAGMRRKATIELSDYRDVAGLRLPHKLTEYEDGRFHRETIFESIVVNPPLTPAQFKR